MSRVSAIVVSFNRADDLRLALESIRSWTGVEVEIIVVDNAWTEAARVVAAAVVGVGFLRNTENLGLAAANNLGL
jgi:GT2 family glycosyltransferase